MEMWYASVFQALLWTSLVKFLPEKSTVCGGGLNVALPLRQREEATEDPGTTEVDPNTWLAMLCSPYPRIRRHAQQAREAYHSLRTSTNPLRRQY